MQPTLPISWCGIFLRSLPDCESYSSGDLRFRVTAMMEAARIACFLLIALYFFDLLPHWVSDSVAASNSAMLLWARNQSLPMAVEFEAGGERASDRNPGSNNSPAEAYRSAEESTQPQRARARYFHHYPNRDLSAPAAQQIDIKTQAQCETMCDKNLDCRAYTFDNWNRRCYLKFSVGELLLNGRTASGVLSSVMQPRESSRPVYLEYFNKKSFSDFGYETSSAPNRDECGSSCLANPNCMAFTFVIADHFCRSYSLTGEYFVRSGFESGAKRQ
jgi:hypothetical protein